MKSLFGFIREWIRVNRFFDIVIASLALFLLIPIIGITSFLVRKRLGSPVFFCQTRPGKNNKLFTMVKFRTMRDAVDEDGKSLSDEDRLTAFGKKLRSTSLDELPELWNVLKGDMSLVGPRPLLVEYLPLYTHEQGRRHEVRPGITGWAQINGRNSISWTEKFQLDVWYVDNQSIWLDMKILFLTVKKVFNRDGISGGGCETMTKFQGTKR